MNTIHKEVMEEIKQLLKEIQSNPHVNAMVLISGKPDNFIAGADINMLENLTDAETSYDMIKEGHQIFDMIATSSKPIVAAIQGSCLGGGLEVTSSNTRIQYLE